MLIAKLYFNLAVFLNLFLELKVKLLTSAVNRVFRNTISWKINLFQNLNDSVGI